MNIQELKEAADHLVSDLNMLMNGEWVPDTDSCQASLDNAEALVDGFARIEKQLAECQAQVKQAKREALLEATGLCNRFALRGMSAAECAGAIELMAKELE